MARTANHSAEDMNLLRILKEKADQYGEAEVKKQDIALEYGISPTAIGKSMDRLKEKGYIDFGFINRGRAGSYFRVWLVDQNKVEAKDEDPVEEEPKLRVCKCCGRKALTDEARFCWNCGATLLTEQEQLSEQLNALMPKVARSMMDASVSNELFQVIGKLRKLAFGEVTLSA
jgi:DNA-binding MarR family transcriptional regulator